MRIVFAIHVDLRNGRGSEKVLLNLLKYKPDNLQVMILETDYLERQRIPDNILDEALKGGELIQIHRTLTGKYPNSFMGIVLNNIILRNFIKDRNRIKDSDIIKKLGEYDAAYLFSNFFAIYFDKNKIPVIGSNHSIDPSLFFSDNLVKRCFYRLYWKIYFKNLNGYHVFPRNEAILKKLETKFGTRYNMVLSNGVDTKLFFPNYNVENKILKILFVASLQKSKGLDILLPLADMFTEDDRLEFHVVGGGPLEKDVNRRKNIKYHKILDDKSLSSLYRESDLFVYPSHDDYYGLVVLEAISSGLYVLVGEYLKGNFDQFEGHYLEYLPMNVESFYHRISDILSDRKIISHNKHYEYEFVRNNYDWSIISKHFYESIEQLYLKFQNYGAFSVENTI